MQIQMDIQQKIEQDFGSQAPLARDEIEALFIKTNWRVSNQLVRSVIYLSKGEVDSLNKNIERVLTDYKDLLWEAEYERGDEKLRDFGLTFNELGLIK